MIQSVYYCKEDNAFKFNLSLSELAEIYQTHKGLLWVNLAQPTAEEIQTVLRETFHFHPLAVEDTISPNYQSPKVDDFEEYLFIIVQALRADFKLERLDASWSTAPLSCFLGHHYLVTVHKTELMASVHTIWEQLEHHLRLLEHGADFLTHAVLDHVVDEYLPLLDAVDEELDGIEDELFGRPNSRTLQRILKLKHNILTIRRIISPQREVMNRLSRDDFPLIARRNRIYYRDIYDHLVRLHDLSEATRDVIGGALDTYLSVVSNRMNQVMKTLAIISTIFLPLSFLAGVYGMNFAYMPGLESPYGYHVIWFIFIFLGVGMLWMFKRRGWF